MHDKLEDKLAKVIGITLVVVVGAFSIYILIDSLIYLFTDSSQQEYKTASNETIQPLEAEQANQLDYQQYQPEAVECVDETDYLALANSLMCINDNDKITALTRQLFNTCMQFYTADTLTESVLRKQFNLCFDTQFKQTNHEDS